MPLHCYGTNGLLRCTLVPHWMQSRLGGFRVQRGVVRVAFGSTAVKRGLDRLVQRRVLGQAGDEIRIGDERASEGEQIRLVIGKMRRREFEVISIVGDVSLAEAAA